MGDEMTTEKEQFEELLKKVAKQQEIIDDITDVACQLRDDVASLTETVTEQEKKIQTLQRDHHYQLVGLFERLGESFTVQAQRMQAPVRYTTTLRRIPDEEAENEGSVFIRLQDDTPVIFKANEQGDLVRLTDQRVDTDVLYTYLMEQHNPQGLHHINLYIEQQ